jgi:hypothetical protein
MYKCKILLICLCFSPLYCFGSSVHKFNTGEYFNFSDTQTECAHLIFTYKNELRVGEIVTATIKNQNIYITNVNYVADLYINDVLVDYQTSSLHQLNPNKEMGIDSYSNNVIRTMAARYHLFPIVQIKLCIKNAAPTPNNLGVMFTDYLTILPPLPAK